MNEKEKVLISKLLDMASDEFSHHGCNDLDEPFWFGWSKEERQKFMKEYHEWNGDPEEYNPDHLHIGDSILMSYFSAKLLKP